MTTKALTQKSKSSIDKAGRLADLAARAVDLHSQAKADNTRSAYASDVSQYETFCKDAGLEPFPATPETLALWIAEMGSRLKYSTIQRKVYAVSAVHRARFKTVCVDDQVKSLLQGLRREKGKAKETTRKAKALTGDVAGAVIRSVRNCGKGLRNKAEAIDRRALRDRALLLLGFAGAFRVSELIQLDIEDVVFERDGMQVILTSSKTNKEGKAETIGVSRWVQEPEDPKNAGELCPVNCLESWISELCSAGIESGRIFRRIDPAGQVATRPNKSGDFMTRKSVNETIKAAAARSGFDGAAFSTHSMRRGHITQAYRNGIAEQDIARTSRHKTLAVLRDYEESANVYQGSAGKIRI